MIDLDWLPYWEFCLVVMEMREKIIYKIIRQIFVFLLFYL